MNLYVRLLLVWLRSRRRDRLHFSSMTKSAFRVLPHDLDAFGHMNNGRYLQIMDVARVDWMLGTGVADAIKTNRWSPLVGGGVIRFRHSLRLFQRYRVSTRLLGWDHRWFYLEHTFIDGRERCVAVGVTRAALHSGSGWVHANDVAEHVYPGARSPVIPAYVREWVDLEDAMFDLSSTHHSAGSNRINVGRAS